MFWSCGDTERRLALATIIPKSGSAYKNKSHPHDPNPYNAHPYNILYLRL